MITLIGDTHCRKDYLDPEYFQAGDIQIGDLCLQPYHKWARYDKPRFFIDGNHDWFPGINTNASKPYEVTKTYDGHMIRTNLFHIPRGYWNNGVLFIGGANSIDKGFRIEGRDWFGEESLSYGQIERLLSNNNPVHTIISHECPLYAWERIFSYHIYEHINTVTKDLNLILAHFNPKRWIFGHHHISLTKEIDGCLYTCLNEGEKLELDLDLDLLK